MPNTAQMLHSTLFPQVSQQNTKVHFHINLKGGSNLLFGQLFLKTAWKQECIQLNTNHPLAESMGCIKFEGM